MSKQLVYRPYHIIYTPKKRIHQSLLHVVDSHGDIVHDIKLPQYESIQFFSLTEYRFAIFFANPGRLQRGLNIYESTTFQFLRHIPLASSILGLIQLRATKQIIILTRAEGFRIYSNNLEFERQVDHASAEGHEGVLVECLHEIEEENNVVTATSDYYLHFWNTKTWTKVCSIEVPPTPPLHRELDVFHRVLYWRNSTLILVTENSFILLESEPIPTKHIMCLDPDKDNHPILLKNSFLYRYGHKEYKPGVHIYMDDLKMDQGFTKLPYYTMGTSLPDGRVLLQTKTKLFEFEPSSEEGEFLTLRTRHYLNDSLRKRHHLNDFQFVFALQTKQDNDLLIKRLDPFVQRAIPILDLRMIVYEFI